MKQTSLVLRSCRADLTSTNGFQWPQVGEVAEAPDWSAAEECGNGLHGWLYGQGDYSCSNFLTDGCKWLVVEVKTEQIVMLGGKVKFPRATVRFIGERHEAAAFIIEHEERSASVAVIGAVRSAGERQAVIVGALGTATAGYKGTATAGDEGTATAGDEGTATAGYKGTATAGDEGTATAGKGGVICIRYYDKKRDSYRMKVGEIGENGLLPNVAYRLNDRNEFEAVEQVAEAA